LFFNLDRIKREIPLFRDLAFYPELFLKNLSLALPDALVSG
jgi:hypothetical protein